MFKSYWTRHKTQRELNMACINRLGDVAENKMKHQLSRTNQDNHRIRNA